MEDKTCFMCEGRYWYMNISGEWCLCPRRDALRIASSIKKVNKKCANQ